MMRVLIAHAMPPQRPPIAPPTTTSANGHAQKICCIALSLGLAEAGVEVCVEAWFMCMPSVTEIRTSPLWRTSHLGGTRAKLTRRLGAGARHARAQKATRLLVGLGARGRHHDRIGHSIVADRA